MREAIEKHLQSGDAAEARELLEQFIAKVQPDNERQTSRGRIESTRSATFPRHRLPRRYRTPPMRSPTLAKRAIIAKRPKY